MPAWWHNAIGSSPASQCAEDTSGQSAVHATASAVARAMSRRRECMACEFTTGACYPSAFKEAGDKRVVFENLAHDFPQRIVYWKDGDLLAARIEATVRGQKRSEEWRFSPIRQIPTAQSGG